MKDYILKIDWIKGIPKRNGLYWVGDVSDGFVAVVKILEGEVYDPDGMFTTDAPGIPMLDFFDGWLDVYHAEYKTPVLPMEEVKK